MTKPVFLVTGGSGCIGSATVANLVSRGYKAVVADAKPHTNSLRLWLTDRQMKNVDHEPLDVTSLTQVTDAVAKHKVTHVIHLAGIQMPGCQANPSLGCMVNVVGTTNVYEAVRLSKGQVRGLAIASSVAADAVPDGVSKAWLYSVWKMANEGTARVYASEFKVGSVVLQPYIVFGRGRWDGLTSHLTKAVVATVAGESYHIGFSGPVVVQDAGYVGKCFVQAALAERTDAHVVKVGGPSTTVAAFITALRSISPDAKITCNTDVALPFPDDEDDGPMMAALKVTMTPPDLRTMVRDLHTTARKLLDDGLIDLKVLTS